MISKRAAHTIRIAEMDPEQALLALKAVGPLSNGDQRKFAERLVSVISTAVTRIASDIPRPVKVGRTSGVRLPSEERNLLIRISKSADRLLNLLVDTSHNSQEVPAKKPSHHSVDARLWPELYNVANERQPVPEPIAAQQLWKGLIDHLTDLREAANRAAMSALQRSVVGRQGKNAGRGGKRRERPQPKGELLNQLFEMYVEFHSRNSVIHRVKCDKQLREFVRAGFALAKSYASRFGGVNVKEYQLPPGGSPDGDDTADRTICRAFYRWRQTKEKKLRDMGVAVPGPEK